MILDFNESKPRPLPSGAEITLSQYDWCKHHFMLVFKHETANGPRFRLRCPMCTKPEKQGIPGVGIDRAIKNMGRVRVENAIDWDLFKSVEDFYNRRQIIRNAVRRIRYHEYLSSEKWLQIREAVISRSNGACERCGSKAEHVHHKTYENLGNEKLQDLEALCLPCHHQEHGRVF